MLLLTACVACADQVLLLTVCEILIFRHLAENLMRGGMISKSRPDIQGDTDFVMKYPIYHMIELHYYDSRQTADIT